MPRSESSVTHRTTEKEDVLHLRADGGLKLAIVADSHSVPHGRVPELLEKESPDAILHAGDIGDLAVLDRLAKIAPVLAVRGNIDAHATETPDIRSLRVKNRESATVLSLVLLHIAVNGPRLRADARRLAKAKGAQVVVWGHSHVPFIGMDHDILVFNPGSIGPRRFQLPILFGVLEIANGGLDVRHMSCETGERWTPSPRVSAR